MLLEGLLPHNIISCCTVYSNNQFIKETLPSKTWSDNKSEHCIINTDSFQIISACAAQFPHSTNEVLNLFVIVIVTNDAKAPY